MGHFVQGVVPAMLGRELLLRTSPLERGKWLFFLLCCVSLAVSACYEFIEWWAAVINDQAAEAFLGTQGDNWDAQWDMFLALTGSILSQLTLATSQDRQLEDLLRR
jgi:putative membrane protein